MIEDIQMSPDMVYDYLFQGCSQDAIDAAQG